MAAAAAAAGPAAGLSPCASFVEESLILPGRNPGLFLRLVALLFAHTFFFLSLAVRSLHPAAAALLSLHADTPPRRRRSNGFGFGGHRSSWRHADYYPSATGGGGDEVLEHGRTLVLVYLAYLASKLAAQVAVALAASATARGGRPLEVAAALRGRVRILAAAAAFLAALELASTALLAACLASWWTTTYNSTGGTAMASFVSGGLLFVLLFVAVPARLCLAAAVPVAIAALTSSSPEVGGGGPSALRRAWRLMAARERRKEAAVLVAAAGLLPVAACPVYAIALVWGPAPGESVWVVLGVLPGYLFPSVAVQLYSTVAAAVFYHRFGHHEPAAIPLTTTKAIAS